MFGAGGSTSTAIKCMRIHCHKAPEKALSFTLLKAIKVQPPGWKKQALLQKTSKNLKSISSNLLKQLVDTAYRFSEQPSLNEGNFGPVNEIGAAVLLKHIDGEIPEEFPEGAYIRNGPNPLNPTQTIADSIVGSTSYLYYEGHGMLHAVHFNKSSLGEWEISYQNKYVASDTFQLEREKNEVTFLPAADGQPYATLALLMQQSDTVRRSIVTGGSILSRPQWCTAPLQLPFPLLLHHALRHHCCLPIRRAGGVSSHKPVMDVREVNSRLIF